MAADLTVHEGDLEPDEDYEGVLFDGASFADADAGHCHFLDCSFVSTSFDGGRLRKARFTDVTLRETRFVACDLAETGWQDVTLDGCALSGVQAFSASMRRVTFQVAFVRGEIGGHAPTPAPAQALPTQIGQHRQHPAVVLRRREQPELGEHVADVGLHGLG